MEKRYKCKAFSKSICLSLLIPFYIYRYLISGFGAYQSDTSLVITDIITALRWIKNNIISFGGNPSEITLLGHSHGAALVNYLLLSKLGKGKKIIFLIMLRFPKFSFIDHLDTKPTQKSTFLHFISYIYERRKVNLILYTLYTLLFCFSFFCEDESCVYVFDGGVYT